MRQFFNRNLAIVTLLVTFIAKKWRYFSRRKMIGSDQKFFTYMKKGSFDEKEPYFYHSLCFSAFNNSSSNSTEVATKFGQRSLNAPESRACR